MSSLFQLESSLFQFKEKKLILINELCNWIRELSIVIREPFDTIRDLSISNRERSNLITEFNN